MCVLTAKYGIFAVSNGYLSFKLWPTACRGVQKRFKEPTGYWQHYQKNTKKNLLLGNSPNCKALLKNVCFLLKKIIYAP
jgi:hypothetical protein